jgi:hypothetical protein
MAVSRRVGVLAVVFLAGAALVALGVVFVVVGLNKANEISGVIGGLTGLVGLGLSVYGIVLARRPQASQVQNNNASSGGIVFAVQDGKQIVEQRPAVADPGAGEAPDPAAPR